MENKKAAKKIIKRAKKHPDWYTQEEVLYAKLLKRELKKNECKTDLVTPDAESTMNVARVSNPNNQENPNYAKLLGYCIKHNHWSVFEQAFMT